MRLVDGLVGVMKRSGEASRFVTLMELTGVTEQLQQMHDFTVFLPDDDAIHVCLLLLALLTFTASHAAAFCVDTAPRISFK